MAAARLLTSIFIQSPEVAPVDSKAPSYSFCRVGELHDRVRLLAQQGIELNAETWENLGLDPADGGAIARMTRSISKIHTGSTMTLPVPRHPGVYYLYACDSDDPKDPILFANKMQRTDRKPFLVFKAGAKRATIETTVRKMALALGMKKYALPGVFAAISNATVISEEVSMELWNGWNKILTRAGLSQDSLLFGILEPFVEGDKPFESYEAFVKFVVFAIALNIRDLSDDNIVSNTCIDPEECMPIRSPSVTPREFNFEGVSRTASSESMDSFKLPTSHLPFLASFDVDKAIPGDIREALIDVVGSWKIDEIIEKFRAERILYFDTALEGESPPEVYEETPSVESSGGDDYLSDDDVVKRDLVDHGGNRVGLRAMFNDDALYVPRKVRERDPIFTERQIEAFRERLEKLVEIIMRPSQISVYDIVKFVDPLYKEMVDRWVSKGDTLRGCSPFTVAGRIYTKSPAASFRRVEEPAPLRVGELEDPELP
ncbi:MAG: hypothetical protein S4CHLAM37_15540 [Chlamydiia bacterium]|nr:hypothetical protein [Chlamydiia bacterium]